MIYGSARVSTDGQASEAQVEAPATAGAVRVFQETASGAKADRAQLRRLLDQVDASDMVTVTRLDRLICSTRDLLNILATITERRAGFRSVGNTWADATPPRGRLMLTARSEMAEFERRLIRTRMGEGRVRAAPGGVKIGRKESDDTVRGIARNYNVHNSTISQIFRATLESYSDGS
jgi:DNA invertase Pin-like site-specific DNA recombinase